MLKIGKRQAQPAPTAQDVHADIAAEHRELTQRIADLEAVLALDGLKSRKERESDRFAVVRPRFADC